MKTLNTELTNQTRTRLNGYFNRNFTISELSWPVSLHFCPHDNIKLWKNIGAYKKNIRSGRDSDIITGTRFLDTVNCFVRFVVRCANLVCRPYYHTVTEPPFQCFRTTKKPIISIYCSNDTR